MAISGSAARIATFSLIAAGGCLFDLATKGWIFDRLGFPPGRLGEPELVLWPGVLSLTTHLNEGALFGLGHGFSAVFAGLSVLAAIAIVYWVIWGGAKRDWWLSIALGLVLAGVLGNLYDRLGLPGLKWPAGPRAGHAVYAVRDWLHFEIEAIGFDWPIFNLADSFLVVGAGMLFWHAAFRDGRQAESTSAA